MSNAALAILVSALVVYAVATVLFFVHLLGTKSGRARLGVRLFALGLVAHATGKALVFFDIGAIPITNSVEGLNLLALVMGITFVLVSRRYGVPALGAFACPLAFVTLAASLAFGNHDGTVPEALRSAWFPVHIGFAIVADALFAVAAASSVAYLVQERMLRRKTIGGVFQRLPPLHVLDEIGHRLVVVGWWAMSVGIVAGAFFAKQRWGAYWQWDPKQTWSAVTWLVFAAILHARLTVGWQGRRTAWLTIGAAILVLLAMVFLHQVVPSRHGGDFK